MEDQDEAALKALGIDIDDPADVANAEASRRVTMRRTWRMTMTIMLENNVSSHQANC